MKNRLPDSLEIQVVSRFGRISASEGILPGGSSRAVFMALDRLKTSNPRGATCVLIFPNRGERYLDTIFSDEWVTAHFGNVKHL
jgi:hypothetical protein